MTRNTSTNHRKRHHPPKRRRFSILPYVLLVILVVIIGSVVYYLINFNVNRNIENLEKAIKTNDVAYLEEKTDRLPIILDVLKKSYSDDSVKEEEFYNSNFINLDLEVLEVIKVPKGKEVRLNIKNVNYIEMYDTIADDPDQTKVHNNYIKALANPNHDRTVTEAKVFLQRSLRGYKVYETKEFINAILGGALDKAIMPDSKEKDQQLPEGEQEQEDEIDKAIEGN